MILVIHRTLNRREGKLPFVFLSSAVENYCKSCVEGNRSCVRSMDSLSGLLASMAHG